MLGTLSTQMPASEIFCNTNKMWVALIYHYNYLINIHRESHISNIKDVVESLARVEEGIKRQFSLESLSGRKRQRQDSWSLYLPVSKRMQLLWQKTGSRGNIIKKLLWPNHGIVLVPCSWQRTTKSKSFLNSWNEESYLAVLT